MKSASWRSRIAASVSIGNIALVIVVSALTACTDDGGAEADDETETGDETGDESLEIVGSYVDDFMTQHSITEEQWSFSGSIFAIAEFDNDAMYVIAQNDEANMFNPGLWSRFDWAWEGEQLYFCQSVYDGPTIDDARAGGADASDLAMGCGGFPWSMLTPQ